MAVEVQRRDGVDLLVRVGLNSGQVIAGEIGSGSLGYRATGQPVGLAQRMEAVAPPGGVMLSESTARLVEHRTVLAEAEWICVKGEPAIRYVPADCWRSARGLEPLGAPRQAWSVGAGEMAALDALAQCTVGGRGGRPWALVG